MRLIIALLARLMGGTCLIVSPVSAFAQTPIAVADAAQQVTSRFILTGASCARRA